MFEDIVGSIKKDDPTDKPMICTADTRLCDQKTHKYPDQFSDPTYKVSFINPHQHPEINYLAADPTDSGSLSHIGPKHDHGCPSGHTHSILPIISEAIKALSMELQTDSAYYESWHANISMAFQDNYRWICEKQGYDIDIDADAFIKEVANQSATHFLRIFTGTTPDPKADVPIRKTVVDCEGKLRWEDTWDLIPDHTALGVDDYNTPIIDNSGMR